MANALVRQMLISICLLGIFANLIRVESCSIKYANFSTSIILAEYHYGIVAEYNDVY